MARSLRLRIAANSSSSTAWLNDTFRLPTMTTSSSPQWAVSDAMTLVLATLRGRMNMKP